MSENTESAMHRSIPPGFIIPDFGGRAAGHPGASPGAPHADGIPAYSGPRKMAFICSKGNLDMVYPALIMGNAALGEGIEVHLFFTFWGLDIVNTKTNDDLKFSFAGNTAMHMPDLGRLRPGLEHRSMPQALGAAPGMTKLATSMMKKQMADLDIPTVPEMLDIMQAAGAHLWACRMSFDMMKTIEADLHPAVEGVISATDFIEISQDAQIVFV